MVAVASTYYLDTYIGNDPGSGLARLLARASDSVLLACPGGVDESTLDDATIELVKKAVCAQTEFWVQNGETYNDSERVGMEIIGSYRNTRNLQQSRPQGALCSRATMYLEQTGLMFRGVKIVNRLGEVEC